MGLLGEMKASLMVVREEVARKQDMGLQMVSSDFTHERIPKVILKLKGFCAHSNLNILIVFIGYRVSYATDPFRWKVDIEKTSTFKWTYQYTFYAFSSPRSGTTKFSVLYATRPDRNRVSHQLHKSSGRWNFKFSFWAYDSQYPNTVPFSVAYAENPLRYRVSSNEHTSNNGWTHLFTFYAYPSAAR